MPGQQDRLQHNKPHQYACQSFQGRVDPRVSVAVRYQHDKYGQNKLCARIGERRTSVLDVTADDYADKSTQDQDHGIAP